VNIITARVQRASILANWEYSFLTQNVKDYADGNLPDVDEYGKENLL
jgi:hypothetical protein